MVVEKFTSKVGKKRTLKRYNSCILMNWTELLGVQTLLNMGYTTLPLPNENDACKKKNNQHVDFPSGHPPEYYPRLSLVNFIERTGYGSLRLIWPIILWCFVFGI